jgi:3-methyladenine DNA glycosylase AlkC
MRDDAEAKQHESRNPLHRQHHTRRAASSGMDIYKPYSRRKAGDVIESSALHEQKSQAVYMRRRQCTGSRLPWKHATTPLLKRNEVRLHIVANHHLRQHLAQAEGLL